MVSYKKFFQVSLVLIMSLVFLCTGCVSTEVVEVYGEQSSTVSLSISTPTSSYSESPTRAVEGLKMRMVAVLYSTDAKILDRKETLAGEKNTVLEFTIDDKGEYIVALFADYVNPDKKNGELYADNYYDTSSSTIKALHAGGLFFNNPGRECFVGKVNFTKAATELNLNVKLQRAISKISIYSEDEGVEDLLKSIAITSCSHFPAYEYNLTDKNVLGDIVGQAEAMDLSGWNPDIPLTSRELFYFYTFGASDVESAVGLGEISFTFNANDGYDLTNYSYTIGSGKIMPIANHKIVVKGKNWIEAPETGDDIIVSIEGLGDTWTSDDPIEIEAGW